MSPRVSLPGVMATRWDPERRIVLTELTGQVDVDAVRSWAAGLHHTVAGLPDGTSFKLLLDLTGYEPESLDAHKAMRMVVPSLLVAHGMRPAFVDLFPEAAEPALTSDRGVTCVAFANVHHDETKMAAYEERIATAEQRFFTNRTDAEAWLATL